MGKSGGASNLLRRLLRPTLSDCMVVWLLVGFCFGVPMAGRISAHDVWWHLQTGKMISAHHAIPTVDVYSFTVYGKPWLVHEWLSLVLSWQVFDRFGFAGLNVAKSLLILATFIVVLATARMRTTDLKAAIVATAVSAFVSIPGWSVRPQLFGYLCFAVLIWLVHRFRRGASMWPAVPLFALWINLHGSWVIGVVVLLATGAELAWQAKRDGDGGRFRNFAWSFLFTIAALFANPRPLEYVSYPFQYLGLAGHGNALVGWQEYVSEWRSPDFHRLGFLPLAAAILSLPVVLHYSRAKIRVWELAVVILFAGLTLRSQRHESVFALVLAPLLAETLGAFRLNRSSTEGRSGSESVLLNWVVLLALPVLIWRLIPCGGPTPYLDLSTYPQRSFEHLRTKSHGGRLLAHYDWGGYAIYSLWPKYRVFVDGRADVYPRDVAKGLVILDDLKPGWRRELRMADPDAIVWPKDKPLVQALELLPEWRRVRLTPDDKVAAVFVPARGLGTRD
jgi:hypothetical protein